MIQKGMCKESDYFCGRPQRQCFHQLLRCCIALDYWPPAIVSSEVDQAGERASKTKKRRMTVFVLCKLSRPKNKGLRLTATWRLLIGNGSQ